MHSVLPGVSDSGCLLVRTTFGPRVTSEKLHFRRKLRSRGFATWRSWRPRSIPLLVTESHSKGSHILPDLRSFATATYENHYEILGVPRDASAKEIKAAYLRISKELHPDVLAKQAESGTSDEAAINSKFAAVNEAYSVLGKPQLKREYDLGLAPPVEAAAGGDGSERFWHEIHNDGRTKVKTDFSGYKTATFEERKEMYGFKKTQPDFYRSNKRLHYYVAAGCVVFIILGAFVHLILVQMMYEKHNKELIRLNDEANQWLVEARARRERYGSNEEVFAALQAEAQARSKASQVIREEKK